MIDTDVVNERIKGLVYGERILKGRNGIMKIDFTIKRCNT
jgi:hypothetical protein